MGTSIHRTLAAALVALLCGCGQQWNLDAPIALVVDSAEIPPSAAQAYFADALRQLGGPFVRPQPIDEINRAGSAAARAVGLLIGHKS